MSVASIVVPTGKLRVAIVVAAVPSPFFCDSGPDGRPQGVTVDLANALARELAVPLDLLAYPNSGEIIAAGMGGKWDVAFMPRDAEREKKFDFGPPYFVARSTYLVPPHSAICSIAEVNRPGVRAVAIYQTTTARSVARTAPLATLREVRSVDDWMALARNGEADVLALSHDILATIAPQIPGSLILNGEFQSVGVCAVVPKGRTDALAFVSGFIEHAKASGLVRAALDRAGFPHAEVAPPANGSLQKKESAA
jgi:polar amino acid transport system substrate-binding protein